MSGVNGSVGRHQWRAEIPGPRARAGAGRENLRRADKISVTSADSATLLIAAATSYKNYHDVSGDPEAIVKKQIAVPSKKSFDESARGARRRTSAPLPPRRIGPRRNGRAMKLPTDERIRHFAGGNDPQLAALYFQFARYLLICSSRPGGQPANLQGLWNDSHDPPWDSKYTININTEMNYWPAEPGNLGECVEPLTAMVLDLTQTGARTAR